MPDEIRRFVLTSGATILLVLVAAWAFGGFEGLSPVGLWSLLVGVTVSVGVGVGLMMLTFHSNRSKRDHAVYRLGQDRHDA